MVKLGLPPRLVEKLVWVPVILFCKISTLSYSFGALYYAKISRFHPLNRLTLWITLF
jgi:hypothetical protein